jgi:hypothetical protein
MGRGCESLKLKAWLTLRFCLAGVIGVTSFWSTLNWFGKFGRWISMS